jgi:excisionase family DNA binding protein
VFIARSFPFTYAPVVRGWFLSRSAALRRTRISRVATGVAKTVEYNLDMAHIENTDQRALSLRDTAARLGCSERNVRRLVQAGELAAFRVGVARCVRVSADELAAFIARRTAAERANRV